MTTALVPGSVQAMAAASGRQIVEALMDVEVVVLVDTSASMGIHDSRGGKQRYDVACEELAMLQAGHPGKLGVISFSGSACLCPDGRPVFLHGSTDLAEALRFVKPFDVDGVRFLIISDGEPNSEREAFDEAERIRGRIDTIYIGPEGGAGRAFLAILARRARGKSATATAAPDQQEQAPPPAAAPAPAPGPSPSNPAGLVF